MDENHPLKNRFLRKVVALSAAGVFLDGYDLFIISVALIYIETQNWLSSNAATASVEIGLLNSSALAGMLIGAITIGRFADKIGRRTLYIIDLVFFVLFGLLTALAANIIELLVFRFLLGIGIGADYPVSSTYVAEFSPKNLRGKLTTLTFAFWGIGSITAAIVGYIFGRYEYVIILGHQVSTWRIMLGSGIVPALIVIILRKTMPESPRWLYSKGESEKAEEIIRTIKEKYGLDYSLETKNIKPERRGRISELLSKRYIKRTAFAWLPWLIMDIGVYGIGISIPFILEHVGFGGTTLEDKVHAILGTIILDLFVLVGFAFAILTIEKIGRLKLQEIGFIGMTISMFLLGLTWNMGLGFIMSLLAIYLIYENAGPNVTTWIIPTEIFPTRLRATAQGSSSAISRFGAIIGTFSFPVTVHYYGYSDAFFIFAIVLFFGFVFTAVLGSETTGASLEESSKLFLEFSSLIKRLSDIVERSAQSFREMIIKYDNLQERALKIKEIEHEADSIVHEIFTRINYMPKPLESVDIGTLATKYDDIVDFINAAAKRIAIFNVPKTKLMEEFANEVYETVIQLNKALYYLEELNEEDFELIRKQCIIVNELENKGDDLLAAGLVEIFSHKDFEYILKYKEIYEYMETISDKCEDVSDIFMDIIVKYS